MPVILSEDSEDKKRKFLEYLQAWGLVRIAAEQLGLSPHTLYDWRSKDSKFARAWDQVIRVHILPHLEAEACKRAMEGSDLLLIFLMKAYDRATYDDKVASGTKSDKGLRITVTNADGKVLVERDTNETSDSEHTD